MKFASRVQPYLLAALLCIPSFLFPQSESSRISKILESSLSAGSLDEVAGSLGAQAAAEKTASGKKTILTFLASLEERSGMLLPAAKHYSEASWSDPAARDYSLLLDAARCYLAANELSQASSLVQTVLLSAFDEQLLVRARCLAAWIQLAEGNEKDASALMLSYADNPAFSDWAPALLFTLYWSGLRPSAKDAILSSWPVSPEAAVLRGEAGVSPVSFWYLMNRSPSSVALFNSQAAPAETAGPPETVSAPSSSSNAATASANSAASASSAVQAGESSGLVWQQTGFFKNREYAEDLIKKLKSHGFEPIVRPVTRPSGTVYYSVLVPEDSSFNTAAKLKNAGFESSLVFD